MKKNIDELKAITKPTQRDDELLAIFEALYSISNNDYETANKQVALIWKRLKEHDTWYLYDIRLINNILYIFPVDVAESIVNLVLKRLKKYKKLGKVSKLSANLQINYVLLLTENEQYSTALHTVGNLITFCIEHNLYIRLAASYVRKGILLENLDLANSSDYYEKGFEILEVTNNRKMIEELKKEIKFYTNM